MLSKVKGCEKDSCSEVAYTVLFSVYSEFKVKGYG